MAQIVFSQDGSYKQIGDILQSKKYLLVCDNSFKRMPIYAYLKDNFAPHAEFNGFTSNPLYEDICKGVDLFNRERCDAIVAAGGGSAIDSAKCIKLFCNMDPDKIYFEQEYKDTGIPLLAIPTTAGTGSESTRYAVVYFKGEKQSVTHQSILPDYAFLESGVLKGLPLYQKKCTLLDAFCQGIESWWSLNTTDESISYSKIAVESIIKNYEAYIYKNSETAAKSILLAANYSGRAINISQTTAPHAMSYKLTSLYKIPHGHAVALCLPEVWRFMDKNIHKCVDPRGSGYLDNIFKQIAAAMGTTSASKAIDRFELILSSMNINKPCRTDSDDLHTLSESVNQTRLKNNPVTLSQEVLFELYAKITKQAG